MSRFFRSDHAVALLHKMQRHIRACNRIYHAGRGEASADIDPVSTTESRSACLLMSSIPPGLFATGDPTPRRRSAGIHWLRSGTDGYQKVERPRSRAPGPSGRS